MLELSVSELLFGGGIAVMAAVGALSVLNVVIFTLTGRKINKQLEQEYGKCQYEIKR